MLENYSYIYDVIRKLLKCNGYSEKDCDNMLVTMFYPLNRIAEIEDDLNGALIESLYLFRFMIQDFRETGVWTEYPVPRKILYSFYIRLLKNDYVSKTVKYVVLEQMVNSDLKCVDGYFTDKDVDEIVMLVIKNNLWCEGLITFVRRERIA